VGGAIGAETSLEEGVEDGVDVEVEESGVDAVSGAELVGALVDAALVDGGLTAFCAMAPGPGSSAFVSVCARRRTVEKKISPQKPTNTVLNFPPYKDVRKIITYMNRM
jgi:hypothetical protein